MLPLFSFFLFFFQNQLFESLPGPQVSFSLQEYIHGSVYFKGMSGIQGFGRLQRLDILNTYNRYPSGVIRAISMPLGGVKWRK